MTKLYPLLWGQCTEALQQVLRGHEYFEENDIRFNANWLLNQIKVKNQGIKEERHSNPYASVHKWIKYFFNFRQAEDESWDKFLKCFLDLSSLLDISCIDVTNHSHLTDMECKELIKSEPNKSKILAKKEAASSYYEALTEMVFLSTPDK